MVAKQYILFALNFNTLLYDLDEAFATFRKDFYRHWVRKQTEPERPIRLVHLEFCAIAETTQDPDSMIDALKKLSVANLSNLTPHPLYVFLNYSHPPVLQRIQALRNFL